MNNDDIGLLVRIAHELVDAVEAGSARRFIVCSRLIASEQDAWRIDLVLVAPLKYVLGEAVFLEDIASHPFEAVQLVSSTVALVARARWLAGVQPSGVARLRLADGVRWRTFGTSRRRSFPCSGRASCRSSTPSARAAFRRTWVLEQRRSDWQSNTLFHSADHDLDFEQWYSDS